MLKFPLFLSACPFRCLNKKIVVLKNTTIKGHRKYAVFIFYYCRFLCEVITRVMKFNFVILLFNILCYLLSTISYLQHTNSKYDYMNLYFSWHMIYHFPDGCQPNLLQSIFLVLNKKFELFIDIQNKNEENSAPVVDINQL